MQVVSERANENEKPHYKKIRITGYVRTPSRIRAQSQACAPTRASFVTITHNGHRNIALRPDINPKGPLLCQNPGINRLPTPFYGRFVQNIPSK